MLLKTLTLINYKNFENKTFDFDSKVNCFVGLNGVGKSNILDSIYHLSYGKSYFNPIPSQNIRHGEEYFMINGQTHLSILTELCDRFEKFRMTVLFYICASIILIA